MSRPRRRCEWWIEPTDHSLWWCSNERRWLRLNAYPEYGSVSPVRRCRTRTAAQRAAHALGLLGGGRLVRCIVRDRLYATVWRIRDQRKAGAS